MNVNTNVPIIFQKLSHYETEDTRFLKVKIWLMHLGENLNGSFFEKEVVEDAIPTLNNTPILAYIEDSSDGDKDFSDHRMVLIKEEGQYKIKYIGQAIGVIPESNNAIFEKRLCDDGVEREFLTVEGLVWQNKWDDAPDILNRDLIKAQSMELHSDYEGEFKDDNLYHFSKFKFYGACGLGKSVLPAMRNATIEVQFTFDGFQKEIQDKMEQFKQFSLQNQSSSPDVDNINISEKEDEKVNEKLELLRKYSLTPESITFNIEELTLEEIESKINEQFSLTAEQFKEELVNQLRVEKVKDDWGWEYSKYSYVDYKDNLVFAYDRDDGWKLYGFEFTVNADKITINFESKKRKKFEIVDFVEGVSIDFSLFPQEAIDYAVNVKEKEVENKFTSEKENAIKEIQTKLDEANINYTNLETEVERLKQFEITKLSEERKEAETELFSVYEDKLSGKESFEELKKNSANYTIENLEKELALLFVKETTNFTFNKREKQTIKINVNKSTDVETDAYGGLIEKTLNK